LDISHEAVLSLLLSAQMRGESSPASLFPASYSTIPPTLVTKSLAPPPSTQLRRRILQDGAFFSAHFFFPSGEKESYPPRPPLHVLTSHSGLIIALATTSPGGQTKYLASFLSIQRQASLVFPMIQLIASRPGSLPSLSLAKTISSSDFFRRPLAPPRFWCRLFRELDWPPTSPSSLSPPPWLNPLTIRTRSS